MSINVKCFKCRKNIAHETEEYYVFVSKTNIDNEPFCVTCYQQDIDQIKELLDPFITKLYVKNFIAMNKNNK